MSETIVVSNLSELYSALEATTGGETILLKGGDYGSFVLSPYGSIDPNLPEGVTIKSIDPDNPAIFSEVYLRNAKNVTFDSVVFDYTFEEGQATSHKPFIVRDSENITVQNSVFDGDLASGTGTESDGHGTGFAFTVTSSNNVVLQNNEIYNYMRGVTVGTTSNLEIIDNEIYSIRSDGMTLSSIQGALIEGNYVHDFDAAEGSDDHRDMIQFFTTGTTEPSTNVTIRNNTLDVGSGDYTQSIFMRNEEVDSGKAGEEMFYQNILIEENTIINGHLHGVTVGEADGLVIRNNTLLHSDGGQLDGLDSGVEIPSINMKEVSKDVLITGNITYGIAGWTDQTDWTVEGNAFVQDQDFYASGWYGDFFIASTLATGEQVRMLPGTDLSALGAGASQLYAPDTDGLVAQFHILQDPNDPAVRIFDASWSTLDGEPLPDDAVFSWNFGDGTQVYGIAASHRYTGGGSYPVSLEVLIPGGEQDTVSLGIVVQDTQVLSFSAAEGFTAYEGDTGIALPMDDYRSEAGLILGDPDNIATIANEHIADLLNAPSFEIDFSLLADSPTSTGYIFLILESMLVTVQGDGSLFIEVSDENGERFRLVTEAGSINRIEEQNIRLSLEDGEFEVWLDGNLAANATLTAPLNVGSGRDLVFGHAWGKQNFDGVITSMEFSANADSYPAEPQTDVLEPSPEPDSDTAISRPIDDSQSDTSQSGNQEPSSEPGQEQDESSLYNTQVLSFSAAEGFTAYEGDTGIALPMDDYRSEWGLVLGDLDNRAAIENEHIADLLKASSFEMGVSLLTADPASFGEVLRVHRSFVLTANEDGSLSFLIMEETGTTVTLNTAPETITANEELDVVMRVDDLNVEIWIDGVLADSGTLTAPMYVDGYGRDLEFGNPWGKQSFDGVITSMEFSANTGDDTDTSQSGNQEPSSEPGQEQDESSLYNTQVLSFSAAEGFTAYEGDTGIALPMDDYRSEWGLVLGDLDNRAAIENEHIADLLKASSFEMGVSLLTADPASFGEVLRVHRSFVLTANEDGSLSFLIMEETGTTVTLNTAPETITANEELDVVMRVDDLNVEIWIDGVLADSGTLTAPMYVDGYGRDLEFGNPWGKQSFDGVITSMEFSANTGDDTDTSQSDAINFLSAEISDYKPGKQDDGDHTISKDGLTMVQESQSWQQVLGDFTVTEDTYLSFDFSSEVEGEIHAIMFTNGETVSRTTTIQVSGIHRGLANIYDYNDYETGSGTRSYDIALGEHFTGEFDRLIFLTDDDSGLGGNSTWSDVVLYEASADEIVPTI